MGTNNEIESWINFTLRTCIAWRNVLLNASFSHNNTVLVNHSLSWIYSLTILLKRLWLIIFFIVIPGGPGHIVEIDETKLGAKRKYARGRYALGLDLWVFGGVVLPIIQDNIEIGSTIYSDTFRPYFTLNQFGYQHQMVNHSREFVSEDGVCTNTIECLWGEIKADLKIRRGYNAQQISLVLDEFMYRREFREDDIFEKILEHIADKYQVNDY